MAAQPEEGDMPQGNTAEQEEGGVLNGEELKSSGNSKPEDDEYAHTEENREELSETKETIQPQNPPAGLTAGNKTDASGKETSREPVEEKNDKKPKRRSGQSQDGSSVPRLRNKRSSRKDERNRTRLSQSGERQLETVILSVFQRLDPEGSGLVKPSVFWEVLDLNLCLNRDEIDHLQGLVQPAPSGLISYTEFASRARDYLFSLYINQPPAEHHWVELGMPDGAVSVIYNKQTGEIMESQESGVDLFGDVINDMYKRSDPKGKGYVTWEMFLQLLQSNEMAPFLRDQDVREMKEFYRSIPEEKASYENFHSLAMELILRVYRAKDPSESPWCKVSSKETGEMWFNKFNGEIHRGILAGEREQEIAFIRQAYAKVEEVNFELEQYKEQCRVLENRLAVTMEEQETLEAQLYETGHVLDQANIEIIKKDSDVDKLNDAMRGKDQQMDVLQVKLADLDNSRQRLAETEQELQNARETIANRDISITERDTNITNLQKHTEMVAEELKTARGEKETQESALSKARHQLQSELKKLEEYEKKVPGLENSLSSTNDRLETMRQSLEEKTSALGQIRKHLKSARERNMDLEKEMEKLEQMTEKLRNMDSEIRTLRTFLATKTTLIEKHKKDLRESRLKVAELEEKDARRAVILADVLEKTARQYQQQLGQSSSGTKVKLHPELVTPGDEELRPYSAPIIPPEASQWTEETGYPSPSPRVMKTDFVLIHSKATPHFDVPAASKHRESHTKLKYRSHTIPKLPLIKLQSSKSFFFPTVNDIKRENKLRDCMLIDHTPSNPRCACELCKMTASVVRQPSCRPETGLTGMTAKTAGLPGYQGETDARELALAEQLRVGSRVLIRMKKSDFDVELMKLTAVVKYVGQIDSEYVDHRIYVGVKLDEAVGDTDGLIKTKRYFTCSPKHGKLVRITNVIAVLPNKSMYYRPLQDISKRNPMQKKNSTLRVSQ